MTLTLRFFPRIYQGELPADNGPHVREYQAGGPDIRRRQRRPHTGGRGAS